MQVLQQQAAMGLARKAGTEEMLVELAIDVGPSGGFRGRGMRGRGRFDPGSLLLQLCFGLARLQRQHHEKWSAAHIQWSEIRCCLLRAKAT